VLAECWLYIYENANLNSIYIGIGNSMGRVYEAHNEAAEALRDAPGTVILQTVQPFSSREDALKAEAAAIHVANFAGTTIELTNLAEVQSSKLIGPAIFTRPGTVDWNNLTQTVIVGINADALEDRPAPFGAHGGALFAGRANKYWSVAQDKRKRVKRLIAVLTGSRHVILGDWDVATDDAWVTGTYAKYPTRVEVPLVDAEQDDPRGVKGKLLVGTGFRLQSGVVYSPDLK